MRKLTFLIAVPIVGIVAALFAAYLLGNLWSKILPPPKYGLPPHTHALAIFLCVAIFPIGMWVRSTATSTRQLLGALIGPIAFLCGWALLLHDIDEKMGGLVEPLDYMESLAPIVGLGLGYIYSSVRRDRPSNNRWRGP